MCRRVENGVRYRVFGSGRLGVGVSVGCPNELTHSTQQSFG
jgi:hypothetical protein